MRSSVKKGLAVLAASSIGLTGCLTRSQKEYIDNRIKQEISQYGIEDEKRTKEFKKKIIAELRLYEQQNKEQFEARVPLEELVKAFDSTYRVVNQAYYETREGNIINPGGGLGSSILLNGGYLLTAWHVVDESFPRQFSDNYWGLVRYHHNELFISTKHGRIELESIVDGRFNGLDYALLKLKGDVDLPYYSPGLNLPDEIKPGMRSAAIGFPLGAGRNIRLGNVEQSDSDAGNNYVTFKNSIIFGDSGGPLFVIEDGEVRLTALSAMLTVMRDWNVPGVNHPTNIGYGLKLENVLWDMKEQLESEELDEKTAKELEEFLKLNEK